MGCVPVHHPHIHTVLACERSFAVLLPAPLLPEYAHWEYLRDMPLHTEATLQQAEDTFVR
jgi:hypothetical protein